MKPLAALLSLFLLAGCATAPHPASVANGTCKVFEAPRYAVKGKKQYDQDWIDSTVEGGVGACGWQRPAARPAEVDAKQKVAKPLPKKKPGWLRFLHGLRKPAAAPAPENSDNATPRAGCGQDGLHCPEPVASEAPPASPQLPAPLKPIDQLLGGFSK